MTLTDPPPGLSLRPAIPDDVVWLEPFYEALMRPYVELTHTWNPARFMEIYEVGDKWIIQWEGRDIGLLGTHTRINYLYFSNIQIRREYQGRGLGQYLIRQVIAYAKELGLPVRLRVLKGNPAMRLYLRLGFQVDEELENCHELLYRC